MLTLASFGIAVPLDKGRVPDKAGPNEAIDDLVPVQNVGGHTGKVMDMALGPNGGRLFTVGRPGEVAEWDTRSGERLRVWRFPREAYRLAYSRFQQATGGRHAVSANREGRRLVGGPPHRRGPPWAGDLPGPLHRADVRCQGRAHRRQPSRRHRGPSAEGKRRAHRDRANRRGSQPLLRPIRAVAAGSPAFPAEEHGRSAGLGPVEAEAPGGVAARRCPGRRPGGLDGRRQARRRRERRRQPGRFRLVVQRNAQTELESGRRPPWSSNWEARRGR